MNLPTSITQAAMAHNGTLTMRDIAALGYSRGHGHVPSGADGDGVGACAPGTPRRAA